MEKGLLLAMSCLLCMTAFSQTIQWQKLYGGSSTDNPSSICHTSDGGSIVAGAAFSSQTGYVKGKNHGNYDIWIVKLNASGDTLWEKLYGGSAIDLANAIQQTADGGYIVAGYSSSSASGDVTGTNHGGNDIWILKLDASGNITWQKLLGGTGNEQINAIQQTADGGYIAVGYSTSSANGDIAGTNHGSAGTYDEWIAKLDPSGNITWQNLLGGSATDQAYAVQQTSDGGYVVAGNSSSSASGDVTGTSNGNNDYWVVKLNVSGNIVWQKLYGGSAIDYAKSIQQTADGGYMVTGYSNSSASGDITATNNGGYDYWIVKLDVSGNIIWQKLYGGSGTEITLAAQQTTDGGSIVAGYSNSSKSGDVTGTTNGNYDYWILKLDASGNITWQNLLGGSGTEYAYSVDQTNNGDYVVAGYSTSSANGDVNNTSNGGNDYWILSLHDPSVTPVILKSFTGSLSNNHVSLQWQSGVESNFNDYTIEQSIDDKTFTNIATVPAKGSDQSYAYKLVQAIPTAYYRLAMADKDGSISYSPVIVLSQKNNAANIAVYPNPAQEYINIASAEAGILKIYDVKGALIKTQTISVGINKINIRDLSAGVYYGSVNTGKFSFVKEQ